MSFTSDHYSFFGVSATYTPVDGSAVSVTVLIEEDPDRVVSGGSSKHEAEIRVQQVEVAARPAYRGLFLIGTQSWYIAPDGVAEDRSFQDFLGEWACKVMRDERPQL